MGDALVELRLEGKIATITMDDGKANALSPRMLGELSSALDAAERAGACVVLTGRQGVFSAGFDLKVLNGSPVGALRMLNAGFALAGRLMSFPTPVVAACNGHALAMGLFLLLSADYRIGTSGPYKLAANEVAIGLTMPRTAIAVLRQRLTPTDFQRVVMLAEPYTPEQGLAAGFLDRVAPAAELAEQARRAALELVKLDMRAHARTKRRARADTLRAIRAARLLDLGDYLLEGARRTMGAQRPAPRARSAGTSPARTA